MSRGEITALVDRPEWAMVKSIEARFRALVSRKHRAWINASRPLVGEKRPCAPKGQWREDAWANGKRLFLAVVGGRPLSTEEREQEIIDPVQCRFL